MNCPYCNREIYALTGFQELQKFQKHLASCRKNPVNIVLKDGRKTVVVSGRNNFADAMRIRADSGQ